jgi:nicotinamidase-related amidase
VPKAGVKEKIMLHKALLIIDVQKGLFEKKIPIYHADEMLINICQLAARAHTADVPVIYVQHTNSTMPENTDGWQLHPHLQPRDGDLFLRKQQGSAFENTTLNDILKSLDVQQLVVTGLVTHGCIKATCLDAIKYGYAVTLVSDANSNFNRKPVTIFEETYAQLTQLGIELKRTENIQYYSTEEK